MTINAQLSEAIVTRGDTVDGLLYASMPKLLASGRKCRYGGVRCTPSGLASDGHREVETGVLSTSVQCCHGCAEIRWFQWIHPRQISQISTQIFRGFLLS